MSELTEYIRSNVAIDSGGCWMWERSRNSHGYGIAFNPLLPKLAHRASFTAFKGPIPEGMLVCHACDVPGCVNPDHLWLGTHQDNIRDASAKKRMAGQEKTHCPQGHEYAPDNINLRRTGQRECKECNRIRARNNMRKLRAKRRLASSPAAPAPVESEKDHG